MITVDDVQRAVEANWTKEEWFLNVLKSGGWTRPWDNDARRIRVNEYGICIVPEKHYITVNVSYESGGKHRWESEKISVHSQLLALHNSVQHLLITTDCRERGYI